MGARLNFVDFDQRFMNEFQTWFEDDELAGLMSYPDEIWLDYLKCEEVTALAVLDESGAFVAEIQLDRDPDGIGFFAITVKPELKNNGIGQAALALFIEKYLPDLKKLVGHVLESNEASIKLLESVGFRWEGDKDDDGFLAYSLTNESEMVSA